MVPRAGPYRTPAAPSATATQPNNSASIVTATDCAAKPWTGTGSRSAASRITSIPANRQSPIIPAPTASAPSRSSNSRLRLTGCASSRPSRPFSSSPETARAPMAAPKNTTSSGTRMPNGADCRYPAAESRSSKPKAPRIASGTVSAIPGDIRVWKLP